MASSPQPEGVVREWPELIVSGCADPTISNIVKGTYRVDTMNHSKPVYKKYEKAKGLDVLVYFWDDRDGLELCGWWFGPSVGGDQVWAFHPSRTSHTPPATEWNIPNDGPIDPLFIIRALSAEEHGDDAVRKQIEAMKKERELFAARMEEIQRRADERKRREEELKRRMLGGTGDGDKKPSKKLKLEEEVRNREEEEEQRRRKEASIANARAEEERRWLEEEARKKREQEQRRVEEQMRQKREEERRRHDEEVQRKLLEQRRKEEEEERKRKLAEQVRRREEEERRRKEEAKRHEERQRKLNEEAKRRKESVSVLGMIEAIARLSDATPQDYEGLRAMFDSALELLLPYTGKQKAALKLEADRALRRTEAYVKQVDEQREKWERWYDLRQRMPASLQEL